MRYYCSRIGSGTYDDPYRPDLTSNNWSAIDVPGYGFVVEIMDGGTGEMEISDSEFEEVKGLALKAQKEKTKIDKDKLPKKIKDKIKTKDK